MKETIRKIAAYGFSPSGTGTFEQDDMDNWQDCTITGRGVVARRQMLNYQMGLGRESYNKDYEALTGQYRFSDSNQRQFYKPWSEFMAADTWADLQATISKRTPAERKAANPVRPRSGKRVG